MDRRVCILPMRDWNIDETAQRKWRKGEFVSYLWGIETNMEDFFDFNFFHVCILPMRDWNAFSYFKDIIWIVLFVSYLWGIETGKKEEKIWLHKRFVSYLWGIETKQGRWCDWCMSMTFVSYLWGIETLIIHLDTYLVISLYLTYEGLKHSSLNFFVPRIPAVCILPMRDWNRTKRLRTMQTSAGLYLTYEGLKPRLDRGRRHSWFSEFVSYLWGIETHHEVIRVSVRSGLFVSYLWGIETIHIHRSHPLQQERLYLTYEGLKPIFSITSSIFSPVCILPMRDWNNEREETKNVVYQFVSYLWGIETTFFTHTFFWTPPVCILPMRDWNTWTNSVDRTGNTVCILPMRDWNIAKIRQVMYRMGSLYLTYEGLKLLILHPPIKCLHCLYLTYEGLKQISISFSMIWTFSVCILPMRDWNGGFS